jgi:tryptophanyl-tRNA synthetase
MLTLVSVPELERMPQYKVTDNKTAQVLTYPVLMAHDVIGYSEVHVGDDQVPHIDLARKIIKRYNKKNETKFLCPKPVITTVKIADLQESAKKMSKSNPNGCLFLDDSPTEIESKIKKAVTDVEGVSNLRVLYDEFVKEPMPDRYGDAKTKLAQSLISRLRKEQ